MRVLLVKLPQEVSEYILLVLKVRWPSVSSFHTDEAGEAMELIHREQPHLVMLYLPERSEKSPPADCFDLMNQIRGFSEVPFIVVGQSDDIMDKVEALEMGADDWVSPYSVPMEFIAKVNAILRRCSPDKQDVSFLSDARLSIDYVSRQVCISGNPVKLTPIQYKILCHLVKNAGRVCTNAELLQHAWGPNYGDEKDILKLSVHRLRSKIERDPSSPAIIVNERGIGYVIRGSGASK